MTEYNEIICPNCGCAIENVWEYFVDDYDGNAITEPKEYV